MSSNIFAMICFQFSPTHCTLCIFVRLWVQSVYPGNALLPRTLWCSTSDQLKCKDLTPRLFQKDCSSVKLQKRPGNWFRKDLLLMDRQNKLNFKLTFTALRKFWMARKTCRFQGKSLSSLTLKLFLLGLELHFHQNTGTSVPRSWISGKFEYVCRENWHDCNHQPIVWGDFDSRVTVSSC